MLPAAALAACATKPKGPTKEEVAAAWRRYIREGKRIRVYVKPERVPFYIRMFGWLYPLFS